MILEAATFRWLCVETGNGSSVIQLMTQPPSGGCVLKRVEESEDESTMSSHLQVAVC